MLQTIIFFALAVLCIVLILISYYYYRCFRESDEFIKYFKHQAELYKRMYYDLKNRISAEEAEEKVLQAEYCTSESDIVKFRTEKAMMNAISSRLAMLIGHDIQEFVEPRVLELGDGKKKISYVFKVKKI